jgi:hypothetical protein
VQLAIAALKGSEGTGLAGVEALAQLEALAAGDNGEAEQRLAALQDVVRTADW